MDGPHSDTHSDSDSSESWTLLEVEPSAAATPSPCPSPALPITAAGDRFDGTDRDEDTDGISIISDSESESIAACEHIRSNIHLIKEPLQQLHCPEETIANERVIPQATSNQNYSNESTGCDDFLGDSSGKLKTYVHRRNKKVSSMLNVILLGSVITAAGVALGHMWGAREDCSLQTAPSVNKILSNLYKLQEENAFLRSKLKELTVAGNFQLNKKSHVEKLPSVKLNKCKRVFEEPLQHVNSVKTTKCMDLELDLPKEKPEFQKTELNLPLDSPNEITIQNEDNKFDLKKDIRKLRQIYRDNRHWLDADIAQRLKEENILRNVQPLKKKKLSTKDKPKRHEPEVTRVTIQLQPTQEMSSSDVTEEITIGSSLELKQSYPKKIISYADSVKSTNTNINSLDREDSIKKKEDREIRTNNPEKKKYKRKLEKIEAYESSDNDYGTVKDNRYSANKPKGDKIKHDRQKSYKRQKRENKYEQWEIKGGYMKDYDSITSLASEENAQLPKNYDKNRFSQEWERVNYIDHHSEVESNSGNNPKPSKGELRDEPSAKSKQMRSKKFTDSLIGTDWFEKRSALRRQARERLEADILKVGKAKSSARWYFRRMSDREQCRVRANNNATKRKLTKRHNNYKNRR